MKLANITLIALLATLVFSCDQTTTQQYGDITEDPLFTEYSNEMETLVANVHPKENINLNLTYQQIKVEFEQSNDLTKTLGKYVENPEFYIERMRSAYLKAQTLQKRYPEIQDPNFNTSRLINIESTTNFALKGDGSCKQQYDTDIAECKTNALIGATACGLGAATLVGALACGAGVVAYRSACGYFADRSFANCVLAN